MMTNPINYCIQRIKNEIPKEILLLATMEDHSIYNNSITLEEKLLTKVIKQYLLMDLNIITTVSKKVSLKDCIITPYLNYHKEFEYLIEFPDEALDGKEIVSASYILHNFLFPGIGTRLGSGLESAMNTMVQSHSSLNVLPVNRLEVVGRNMVLCNTGTLNWTFIHSIMEVNLAPNSNLSHIKGQSIFKLGDLAVLSAKKWIYNTLTIQVDQGYIRGGHSIDGIRSKIDSYESAFDEYKEKLFEWNKTAFMSDTRQYQKFIEMQLG